MKNKLAITILERDNYESPNIGTIVGATEEELVAKATTAIESHFDGIVTSIRIKNGLKFSDLKNSPPIDIYATIDGTYEVVMDAQETWIF
jgi:hypothetical protein